jgi:hypothetical protein
MIATQGYWVGGQAGRDPEVPGWAPGVGKKKGVSCGKCEMFIKGEVFHIFFASFFHARTRLPKQNPPERKLLPVMNHVLGNNPKHHQLNGRKGKNSNHCHKN